MMINILADNPDISSTTKKQVHFNYLAGYLLNTYYYLYNPGLEDKR